MIPNKTHRAKKSLGQNFLKSEMALRKIIEAGEIKSEDVILEIGPGRGALTKQLLGSSGQVLAVEKDRELVEFLREKFKKEIEEKKLILVEGNILEFNTSTYNLETRTYKIIANIPYNITGAILKKFLTAKNQPTLMVLMVQHEVATRIMGRNGPAFAKATAGKKESILSISVKAYGEPKMIAKVDKRYFSPAPKVNSAIISITNISRKNFLPPLLNKEGNEGRFLENLPHPSPLLIKERVDEEKFWEIVKTGFAHKRKKLSSNLKTLKLGKTDFIEKLGNQRAEDLTLADWIELAK
jgi:16S rRNA (adenine1518-N6/adenine1519-N6)-dimethyltransferase